MVNNTTLSLVEASQLEADILDNTCPIPDAIPEGMKRVVFLYRCGANWRDYYAFNVPIDSPLVIGENITMGNFGTPTQDEFFGKIHGYPFDPEYDHNLLEVSSIS